MTSKPPIGIGHLTLLDVSPPDLVTIAADTGFDAVGIRAAVAAPTEQPWPMRVGSPMLAETMRRLNSTGVDVLDVEIVRLQPNTIPASHERLFEVGARLGASFLNVLADDPDLRRVRDNFWALTDLTRSYGLRPVIEPMVYMSVRNLQDAVFVAEGSGGGIQVDPLHLQRFGGTIDEVRALDRSLLLFYQLCDAPLAAPSGLSRARPLPRGQSMGGTDLQYEARGARLLPGEGELPLDDLIAAMPAGIPISVEAPNLVLREQLGAREFARRARQATGRLIAHRQVA